MSDVIIIIPLTPIPEFPSLAYRALGTYNSMAYTWAKHIREVFAPQLSVMATATQQNAELVAASIVDAAQAVTDATAQADLAMGYRNTANAAAMTATTQAGIATGAAGTATIQAELSDTARIASQAARDVAIGARDVALGARDDAALAALASQGFRDQAEVFATQQLVASSATSLTPGAGSQTFAVEPSRSFVPGMYLVATSTGTPAARMAGYVSSYDGATGQLVINVDAYGGAGAHADWAIGVAVAGQVGGITTQLLTTATTVNVVPNVEYIVGIAGLTLDMTSTTWAKGDAFAISEAIGTGTYTLNFGTTKDRTRTRGSVTVNAKFLRLERKYEDTTRGLI